MRDEEAEAVDLLFEDYCMATNWQLRGQPEKYLRDRNMAEKRATRSFYVQCADGDRDDFNYIEAVQLLPRIIRYCPELFQVAWRAHRQDEVIKDA